MAGRLQNALRRAALMVLVTIVMADSALLIAEAGRAPSYDWLAWISLVPLFACLRVLSPASAFVAGAGWAAAISLWSSILAATFPGSAQIIPPGAIDALAVGVFSAAFAALSRRIGFNPWVLATGWVLLEVALQTVMGGQGIVASTQSGYGLADGVAAFLGSALTAFLPALGSGWLAGVITRKSPRPAWRSARAARPQRITYIQKDLVPLLDGLARLRARPPPRPALGLPAC
jgi:apolipoprotein N-acyltransferase